MTNKTYQPLLIHSVKASSDLKEHRFVGFNGNYCAAGDKALGVCDVSTENGQYAPVGVFGFLLVEAGGVIEAGSAVTSDANGKAVAVSSGDEVNGYALDSAVAGQEIRILRGI